jgi:hypothetical protein
MAPAGKPNTTLGTAEKLFWGLLRAEFVKIVNN